MEPGSTELGAKETVGSGVIWCQRTFRNTVGSVHVAGLPLTDTVPMDASAVVLEFVVHGNLKNVPPVGEQGIAGHFTIDTEDESLESVWGACAICDIDAIRDGLACHRPIGVIIGCNTVAIAPALPSLRTMCTLSIGNQGRRGGSRAGSRCSLPSDNVLRSLIVKGKENTSQRCGSRG